MMVDIPHDHAEVFVEHPRAHAVDAGARSSALPECNHGAAKSVAMILVIDDRRQPALGAQYSV
jgi:hypothetical protein